jgi:hypothetical protein
MWYIHEALFTFLVEKHDPTKEGLFSSEGDNNQCFSLLCQLEDATICVGFPVVKKLSAFLLWLFGIWEVINIPPLLAFFSLTKLFAGSSAGTCIKGYGAGGFEARSILSAWNMSSPTANHSRQISIERTDI